jgi:hypothetical protein
MPYSSALQSWPKHTAARLTMLPDPKPKSAAKAYNNPKLCVKDIGSPVEKMTMTAKSVVKSMVLNRPMKSESQPAVQRPNAEPLETMKSAGV